MKAFCLHCGSTLVRGVASMLWALWRTDDERAFKVHLEYESLKGAPGRATLTDGKTADGKNLRDNLSASRLYVLDRGYADYALLAAILDARSSFLVRLPSNAVTEVLEEHEYMKKNPPSGPGQPPQAHTTPCRTPTRASRRSSSNCRPRTKSSRPSMRNWRAPAKS
jgi:hypothetical protein